MPILVNAIGHSIKDSLGAVVSGEEAHRPGPSPHLPEVPLQHVGSAHLLPQLLGEGEVVEAVVEVLLHAPDRPFFLYLPFSLPGLEPLDGLPPAGGIEDVLGLGHTWLQVHPLQLDGHVPQLVNDAPLHFEKWVYLFECLQEGWIPVGGDKPQGFAQKPTALEVYQKARQLSVSSRSTSRKESISLPPGGTP